MRKSQALVLMVALAVATPAAAREFRSSDAFPAGHPTVQAVAHMGDRLRERSSGRLTISSLGENDPESESFTVAQVRNGALDMARVNLNVLNSAIPGTVIPTLPFLFKSTHHMHRTLDGAVGQEILAGLERHGVIGLAFYDGGVRSFYSRTRPIRSAADLKGLRVRVQKADSWAVFLRGLGAQPIMMPMGQVRAGLQSGVVDAADGDLAGYVAGRHFLAARYYSLTRHSQPPSVLIFSARSWRLLSADDQKMIRDAAQESVAFMRARVDDHEAAARAQAEAAGARIVDDVDRASFLNALVPLYSSVVEEARLQDTVTRIQADQ
jgi:tripartite ATP-independent transporter DctP family solute receptor